MKLLFLSHYGDFYGANRSLLSLLKGLKNRQIQLSVIVAEEGEFTEELKKNGIEYRIISFSLNMHVIPPKEKGVKKLLRKLFFLYSAAKAKAKNKKAIIRILRWTESKDISIVHSNASVFDVGQFVANALKVPHIQHFREFGDKDYFLVPYTSWQEIRQKWKKLAAKIVISKAIQKHHFMENEENTHLIYNGIFEKQKFTSLKEQFEKHQQRKISEVKPFVFSILGLLHPSKGQAEAIRAFAEVEKKHPNTVLKIIGKSNFKGYQEELEKLVTEYSLQNKIIFEGYISKPISKLIASDVLLMCSQAEGMGRVTIEGMACGCVVIGKNSGATAELIENKKTGLLYDVKFKNEKNISYQNLAKEMIFALENKQACKEMRKNAFAFVEKNFSIENYVDKVIEVYTGVLKK